MLIHIFKRDRTGIITGTDQQNIAVKPIVNGMLLVGGKQYAKPGEHPRFEPIPVGAIVPASFVADDGTHYDCGNVRITANGIQPLHNYSYEGIKALEQADEDKVRIDALEERLAKLEEQNATDPYFN